MLVLALDTTTAAAAWRSCATAACSRCSPATPTRTHATRLPGDILDCLARHGLGLRDIDLYGVAVGPGSFTGLRIGIATIQGLAFANGRPVVGVSALDALVEAADAVVAGEAGEGCLRAAWMDAQRGEVYGCLYRRPGRSLGAAVRRRRSNSPAEMLAAWAPALAGAAAEFVGDGAVAHAAGARRALCPAERGSSVPVPPLAAAIAAIAARRRSEAGPPHRDPPALRAAARRRAGAGTAAGGSELMEPAAARPPGVERASR